MSNSLSNDRSSGYRENYFSIDDILSSQERIPCKFITPVKRLGFLDPSADSEDLSANSKLELPYWLARALCSRKRHIVSIEIPKQYREGNRHIYQADPNVVDLHKMGPYFYTFGTQLLSFGHTESTDIAKTLLTTFQGRFRRIMDCSQNAYFEDGAKIMSKLDELEKVIYKYGQLGLKDFKRWETRETEKLDTSHMVSRFRKRKRVNNENS
ncbi:DNA replication complex GINS protein PSF3-like [Tubulanus polymorphus]|uniref:DNA replication complex GINS protein PSF3-like n=1 Tax=Tubulanus polymorphus TaxID=672921 RepID=UPI003DA5A136